MPNQIIVEALSPEKCEDCGQIDELRPYGPRKENGLRMWVCFDCGMKDVAQATEAFIERLEGKNPVSPEEKS